MVYNRYLIRKRAYLEASPRVKESQYQRVVGLRQWDGFERRYIKETRLKYC